MFRCSVVTTSRHYSCSVVTDYKHVDIQWLHTTCRCSASGYYLQFFCFDVHWLLPADILLLSSVVTNFICLDVQWSQSAQSCLKDVIGQLLAIWLTIYINKQTSSLQLFKQSSIQYCHTVLHDSFGSVHCQHERSPCYIVCCLHSV